MALVQPRLLRGRDRYERRTEAWTDSLHADALTHTVRLGDDDGAVEVVMLALPSPSYEIREAACRALAGDLAPDVVHGVTTLAGTRMVAGFTRKVAEATGGSPGGALVVDAAVEVARLARQTTRLPRARAERAAAGAWECWQLDMAGWADLPDSCFTYSPAGRALFATRAVATSSHPDLYSPRPGQRRVFVRAKLARIERADGRLRLFHAMHDNVHGFEVTCEVDGATGTIVRAEHVTPRLPYAGICSEPQTRLRALVGERVDDGLRKRLGGLVGGPSGCTQLYDLTADLLKLLTP
ncbi:MAG TPA: DUF2889 domain-containing protein [Methylomirabilota bacterium]|nr:DUF2889 domain-containing protein [Methylomirabilota bacterium]